MTTEADGPCCFVDAPALVVSFTLAVGIDGIHQCGRRSLLTVGQGFGQGVCLEEIFVMDFLNFVEI